MRDKQIKQLLKKFDKEIHKQTISQFTELYRRFNEACIGFKKKLEKLAGKERFPKISEEIEQTVQAYTNCFFEIAYAYYDKGYFEGMISGMKAVKSE